MGHYPPDWLRQFCAQLRLDAFSGLERLKYLLNMSTPAVKCFLPFEQESVALIDRRNSRNRACLVIEDLIGNVGWHA
jgi:hypothetical protein